VDPDDGLTYEVIQSRKDKGLIFIDRRLKGSKSNKYDTLHALDVLQYYNKHNGNKEDVDIEVSDKQWIH
jgi:hypothetical protein